MYKITSKVTGVINIGKKDLTSQASTTVEELTPKIVALQQSKLITVKEIQKKENNSKPSEKKKKKDKLEDKLEGQATLDSIEEI